VGRSYAGLFQPKIIGLFRPGPNPSRRILRSTQEIPWLLSCMASRGCRYRTCSGNARKRASVLPDVARPLRSVHFSASRLLKQKIAPLTFSITGGPPRPSPAWRRRTRPLPTLFRTTIQRRPLSTSLVAKGEAGEACACTCVCALIHLAPSVGRWGLCHRSSPSGRPWPQVTLCFKCFRCF
jgi:hypothetical protein